MNKAFDVFNFFFNSKPQIVLKMFLIFFLFVIFKILRSISVLFGIDKTKRMFYGVWISETILFFYSLLLLIRFFVISKSLNLQGSGKHSFIKITILRCYFQQKEKVKTEMASSFRFDTLYKQKLVRNELYFYSCKVLFCCVCTYAVLYPNHGFCIA